MLGTWISGLVLFGRSLSALAYADWVGLDIFAIEELTVAGSRLQRVLKLFRKVRGLRQNEGPAA